MKQKPILIKLAFNYILKQAEQPNNLSGSDPAFKEKFIKRLFSNIPEARRSLENSTPPAPVTYSSIPKARYPYTQSTTNAQQQSSMSPSQTSGRAVTPKSTGFFPWFLRGTAEKMWSNK